MKVLAVNSQHQLEFRTIPDPKIGPYEALVRIKACGICATTDSEIIKGTQPYHSKYPCLLGHEAVGEVIETGAKVKTYKRGDLVTRPVGIWPGTDRDGLTSGWGGFAELGIVRDRFAMADDGDASLLYDYTAVRQQIVPAGTPIHHAVLAISLAETASFTGYAGSLASKTVCVAGTGIAGLAIALWCKLAGASKVIVLGRRDARIEIAKKIAADDAINVKNADAISEIKRLTSGRGVDLFVDAVGGKDQVPLGLKAVAPGGTVAIYGVTSDQQYQINMGTAPENVNIARFPAEEHKRYQWVVDLLRRGIVPADALMTHCWPFASAIEAFVAVEKGDVVKGMVEM